MTLKIRPQELHVDLHESVKFPQAVVAYLDILGFSQKSRIRDIKITMLDFFGPLVVSAMKHPRVRFNVFSDCAFVAARRENAGDFLSAIRSAFREWISDGILVRGGVALGTYREVESAAARDFAPRNLVGSLFSGSAVTEAVRLEGGTRSCGSLLFTNRICAEFFRKGLGERIFELDGSEVIGWSDDDQILFLFAGISTLRSLRFLSAQGEEVPREASSLLNNIRYSFVATDGIGPRLSVLAVLSMCSRASEARKKTLKLLGIKEPDDFIPFKRAIDQLLKSGKDSIRIMKFLADSDSSLPRVFI